MITDEIKQALQNQQFDTALALLHKGHDQLHDKPLGHLHIHALWIVYLCKVHGWKQRPGEFGFQILALCFSLPVSVLESLQRKIKSKKKNNKD